MSAQLLSSKIVIQEEPPSARNVAGVPTGVLACIGITEKGPVGKSTLLFSYEEFVKIFGGDVGVGYAAGSMQAFFQGGGQRSYFTRIVHYTLQGGSLAPSSKSAALTLNSSPGQPAAAQITGTVIGPYSLTPGDTLAITRDAAGLSTATFTATAASISTDAGPFDLANGQTVALRIDGGAPRAVVLSAADFVDITAATAEELALVIAAAVSEVTAVANVDDTVTITSKQRGTGSSIEVISGGTASAALGLTLGIATGTGNVDDITAVKISEIKTIVEAAVSGVTVTDFGGAVRITAATTGASGLLQVQAASTADDELGIDNLAHPGGTGAAQPTLTIDAKYPGTYANRITVLISPATSGIAAEFNLSVYSDGVLIETFPNLTMFNGDQRHIERVVNATDSTGSRFIQATDLRIAPGAVNAAVERPANSGGTPAVAFGPLSGGDDGLVGISEADFVGDSATRSGFYSFDLNDDPDLLICPEVASPAVHNAALSYCSVTRNGEMFFIADPPAGLSPEGAVNYVTAVAAIKNTTEHGAFYWPRVKVLNPNTSIYGSAATIIVPPSGHIAGMFARVDSSKVGGVYLPPGGTSRGILPNVLGFENEAVLDEKVRDFLTPALINPITRLRGSPIAVDDVMTLRSNGAFPTIAERRGVTFIERSVKDGLQWARLENNDETLRCAVERTIRLFLLQQMRYGAFRSQNPDTAFYIDVGEALNPPSEQFAGKLNVRIGLATQKPARWIIITVAQDTRALDAELAAAS